MREQGRLQKAVEITIAAGYQMDKDAFEFLTTISAVDDPTDVMSKALQKIECLEEKPFFICKNLLESVLQEPEAETEPQADFTSEPAAHEPLQQEKPRQYPEANSPFRPYAKDVESEINVLEDPTGKLSSNGSMEDFLHYFQDRFKRMEKLLRQRMDLRAATPISEALKSQAKAKLKIIGMVTEKREAKQQLLVTIEDLNATATILVPTKAPEEVQKKAQMLLPDQVICVAVVKTRGRLFMAEDIIFPEVGQKPMRRASEPVYAVLTSDIHIGSNKFSKEAFKRFLQWLNGQYGNERMREIAGHVKYCLVAGDVVDGVGVFPGQALELNIRDVHKQYKMAARALSRLPEHIEIVVSPGNHDAPRKALPQPAISEEYLPTLQGSRRIYSLGNPCTVSLHGVEVLMYHGRSLDDIIGSVPGTDHEHPEKAMKLFLQGRHLAPIYGGKTTLSPENRDFLVIDRVPDIFHAGHIHVLGMCNHRGVLVVNSGGWQEQTDYMAKLGLVPTPGKVPVVNLQTMETKVLSFL
ncbi:MAG: DNA-directed DNA polymerase II small subunit [Candidatus Bathyarchaeota archaeon]|nr:DNA-directed DNA polymerase II small subunit [Candidatus Bathyarchaeota archaeon]